MKKIYDEQAGGSSRLTNGGEIGGNDEIKSEVKIEPFEVLQSGTIPYNQDIYYTRNRNNNFRYNRGSYKSSAKGRESRLNPMVNGQRLKYIICKRIYHLIKDCDHKNINRYGYNTS